MLLRTESNANNWFYGFACYCTVRPPSTASDWPTMNEASSEARNEIAGTISSGSATLPIGWRDMMNCSTFGSWNQAANITVSVAPGQTASLRMFWPI